MTKKVKPGRSRGWKQPEKSSCRRSATASSKMKVCIDTSVRASLPQFLIPESGAAQDVISEQFCTDSGSRRQDAGNAGL